MKKITNWCKTNFLLPFVDKNDETALKSFAITMAIVLPLVFMALLPWLFNAFIPMWPIYISFSLSGLYIFAPKYLYYPYVVWMLLASVLGWINTRIILAIAYYFLIVPIGLIMQWRNGLEYKPRISEKSAWIKRDKPPKKENLKEPF